MVVFDTSVDIGATPEQVWAVLADRAAYPEWNPFIVRSTGELAEGATIENVMRDADGTQRTFTPTLLVVRPGRELRWLGRFWLPGLFSGEHAFVIEPRPGGGVTLRHTERFRGLLVPLLARTLRRGTLPQFHAMNAALAERVRATAAPA